MAGTPCPNCKSFMTKFGDQFMCKKCGTIIDSCSLQHNSSQIQKKQNCHKYKNDYVNLAKEIKSLTIETHKKIIDLSTLLGGDIEIEEVSIDINEKNFQVSILKNIDQFTTEINETHEMLYSYVSNIC